MQMPRERQNPHAPRHVAEVAESNLSSCYGIRCCRLTDVVIAERSTSGDNDKL